MSTTYGERLLEEAEDRSRRKRQIRRLVLVLGPAAFAVLMAVIGTIGFRGQAAGDAGFISRIFDSVLVIGYAGVLVVAPLYAALAPALNAWAAAVALAAGPIAMPILFGPGWRVWHRGVVGLACLMVIAARYSQRDPRTNLRRRGRHR